MAMGQQQDRRGDLMVGWAEMARSAGHVFNDRLQSVLIEGGFDGFAEATCKLYYATRLGAPSVPPGRYFRMHLVGYFESRSGVSFRRSAICRRDKLNRTVVHLMRGSFAQRDSAGERSSCQARG